MILVLIALAVSALISPPIIKTLGSRGFYVLALAPAAGLAWVVANWPAPGAPPRVETIEWIPSLQMDIVLRFDTLSAVMSVLILGVGALVLIYCANYFQQMRRRVAVFGGELVAFAGAMFGLVVSDNTLVMYVFWEATTVLSFMLVGFNTVRATSRRAATQALLVTTFGGLAMLVGIIMLGERTGSYLLSDLVAHPPAGSVYIDVAVILVLIGALSKSAIVPFHFWLPGAMAAPTPVSAYLHAAAMVKAGVYLVARLAPAFAPLLSWQIPVIGLGLLTMVLGGWRSLRELDLKLVLAFGTVSQLGFITVLVGVGDANVAMAGLAMVVAHAMFKACLFMVVGIIDKSTGTRDIRKLARLGARLPGLAAVAAVAGASMAGLPFTFGFVGKETAFGSVWDTGALSPMQRHAVDVVLLVGSVITFAYTTRFLWGAFGRKVRRLPTRAVAQLDQPAVMFLVPPALLSAAGVVAAFASGWIGSLFEPYAQSLPAYGEEIEHLAQWHGFGLPVVFSIIVVAGGAGLFLFLRARRAHVFVHPPRLNADRIYDGALRTADTVSLWVTRNTQRGSLPITQGVILSTAVILPVSVLFLGRRQSLHLAGFDTVEEIVIGFVMVAAAIATAVLRNRLAGLLTLGITGYGCGALFAMYGAPDLALTQFLVESLTLVVFVLVLRKLPSEATPKLRTGHRPIRIAISVAFGAMLVVIGLFAAAARSTEPLHVYLGDAAYEFGHGANAVNVLLVDIRAWDTLGEISVLIVAATGVASMVFRSRRFGAVPRVTDSALAQRRNGDDAAHGRTTWLRGSEMRDPAQRSLILEATTRLVFPTLVVLSVYFFFAGHNAPGGGFAGGLVMGLALVLRYLAGGRYELGEAMRVEAGTILGAGLAVSATTAAVSLALGAPALSSAVIDLSLPVFGEFHIVTALFFDLGIYLIVVGLVLDILRSLGARLDVADAPPEPAEPAAPEPEEVR
ncbi:Na+/H+ antiporter subunit A [Gordonia sp. PS3]|uniref:Na(+)/H(+) antiporter subunit A/B n=1 Tax=Gordonia sihwensis NBRC 108236 TaxID=1223544 RepID=L7LQY4_9ACTN|nr:MULTISPECIES: Na+/H+ antiporter subunit A [Gordonia]AUH67835.1 Na+/H+ antiporter subunit A [Gordonia sp. YC-JH1]WFN92467.1 Na+/H+ antiporter subunit A [Gordonia sihwensis]GAC62592.1 Na(+)/H(+) antiporter subunit A/B [Gordonia sihwensis NBRC 108236]